MDADEIAGYAKEREVLGDDPYVYVLGKNEKRTLAALNRYQIKQGLLNTMIPIWPICSSAKIEPRKAE